MMDSVRRLVRLQFPAHAAAVKRWVVGWRRAVQGLSALGGTPPQNTDHTFTYSSSSCSSSARTAGSTSRFRSGPSVHPPPRLPRPPSAPSRDAVAAVEDRSCRVSTGEGGGCFVGVWRLFMSVGDFWIALGACARQVGARRRTSGGLGDPRKSRRRMAWGVVH